MLRMLPLLALLALVGCHAAAASPVYRVQVPLAVQGSTAGITPPRLTAVDTHEVPEDGRISVYVRVRNDTPDVAYTPGARVAYAGSDGATLAADAERGAFRTLPPGRATTVHLVVPISTAGARRSIEATAQLSPPNGLVGCRFSDVASASVVRDGLLLRLTVDVQNGPSPERGGGSVAYTFLDPATGALLGGVGVDLPPSLEPGERFEASPTAILPPPPPMPTVVLDGVEMCG